jgi:hypothetical protein
MGLDIRPVGSVNARRLSSEMGRRLAVRRRAGREGSWHVDGQAAREIGQSKVVKDRFEEIRDLVAWAGAQRLNRDRNARQVDRAPGIGRVPLLIGRVLDESGDSYKLAVDAVARVRVRGLAAEPLRDDLFREKTGFCERDTDIVLVTRCGGHA